LETDFGDVLDLVFDASGKLLAFPDSLNTHALVYKNQQLKKELNELKENNTLAFKISHKAVGKITWPFMCTFSFN